MSQEHDAQMQELLEVEAAPIIPQAQAVRWMRENLFYSVISGLLTVVTALALIGFVYGLLSWVFAPQRDVVPLTPVTAEEFVAYYEGDLPGGLELEARTIVLLNPDRPGNVCFVPRKGAFGIEVTKLPRGADAPTVYDADGQLIHTLRVDADGRASHRFAADVHREAVPWRLHLPVQQATVQIDGVTRWEPDDRWP